MLDSIRKQQQILEQEIGPECKKLKAITLINEKPFTEDKLQTLEDEFINDKIVVKYCSNIAIQLENSARLHIHKERKHCDDFLAILASLQPNLYTKEKIL